MLCEAGHTSHDTRRVMIHLNGRSLVSEFPAIPPGMARSFVLDVFEFERYAGAYGRYCPGQDDLSHSILVNGVWEGFETVLALDVLTQIDGVMIDHGAHLGWYCMLAGTCGRDAVAIEGDEEVLSVLAGSWAANEFTGRLFRVPVMVGPNTPPIDVLDRETLARRNVALWKIDIEGAEQHAIQGPMLGHAAHILLEVSPCFNGSYPALLHRIMAAGYDLYVVPSKPEPSVRQAFERDPWGTLRSFPVTDPEAFCRSIYQENVWCIRRG